MNKDKMRLMTPKIRSVFKQTLRKKAKQSVKKMCLEFKYQAPTKQKQ